MVLVMGGGEGVGSLREIVTEIFLSFVNNGINATICVVCAKNNKLKQQFDDTNWNQLLLSSNNNNTRNNYKRFLSSTLQLLRRQNSNNNSNNNDNTVVEEEQTSENSLSRTTDNNDTTSTACTDPAAVVEGGFVTRMAEYILRRSQSYYGGDDEERTLGNVTVVPLGFVTRMAEYMAAADVLITKAGPGTIAEAASMGLPILLTSFLPGQEAGNVDLVLENGFGEYVDQNRPKEIANVVTGWMKGEYNPTDDDDDDGNNSRLKRMSEAAIAFGNPQASKEIVLEIGSETHAWMDWNKKKMKKKKKRSSTTTTTDNDDAQ